jgi:parallel beta-helix repeat protein
MAYNDAGNSANFTNINSFENGIYLNSVTNSTISNLNSTSNTQGILLSSSSGNSLVNVNTSSNVNYGIRFHICLIIL